jgi:hypothetical protein
VDVGAAEQDWSSVFEEHFSTKDETQVEAEEYVVAVVDVAGRRRLGWAERQMEYDVGYVGKLHSGIEEASFAVRPSHDGKHRIHHHRHHHHPSFPSR